MRDAATKPRRRVVIIKTLIKQYRRPFFEELHAALAAEDIDLTVLYSEPDAKEITKGDNVELSENLGHKIPRAYLFGERLLLQWPGLATIARADLIVVVNANRNALNFVLLPLARLGVKNVALWGHGQNHQGDTRSASERLKRLVARMPTWWFAYTTQTAKYLTSLGYDSTHITTINNAIDTRAFAALVDAITTEELTVLRAKLRITEQDRVALYCGALYEEKRIPVLLEAAKQLAARDPRFKLIIIGGGPMAPAVREACDSCSAVRYLGPLFGRDKATCYRLADIVVNPGLVGLAILDAFAAGRPLITLADSLHSPEIAYLAHNENGLMLDGEVNELVDGISRLLGDEQRLTRLKQGATKSSREYTLDNMVHRVRDGILKCLGSTPRTTNTA